MISFKSKDLLFLTHSRHAGLKETPGRRASGYIVESLDNNISLHIPTLLECNQIPNIRCEIPTPDAASHFSHLRDIAHEIPALALDADILLLGRDLIRVHKVCQQIMDHTMLHLLKILILGGLLLEMFVLEVLTNLLVFLSPPYLKVDVPASSALVKVSFM